jgi:hypothetical protein
MVPKEPKIRKQAAAGTSHITFTIPETLKIIRKHGIATCHCHYGSIRDWIVGNLWRKETQGKKLPLRN